MYSMICFNNESKHVVFLVFDTIRFKMYCSMERREDAKWKMLSITAEKDMLFDADFIASKDCWQFKHEIVSLYLSCHAIDTIVFNFCCSNNRKKEGKGKRLSMAPEEHMMVLYVASIESKDSSFLTIALFVDFYF